MVSGSVSDDIVYYSIVYSLINTLAKEVCYELK